MIIKPENKKNIVNYNSRPTIYHTRYRSPRPKQSLRSGRFLWMLIVCLCFIAIFNLNWKIASLEAKVEILTDNLQKFIVTGEPSLTSSPAPSETMVDAMPVSTQNRASTSSETVIATDQSIALTITNVPEPTSTQTLEPIEGTCIGEIRRNFTRLYDTTQQTNILERLYEGQTIGIYRQEANMFNVYTYNGDRRGGWIEIEDIELSTDCSL